MSNPFGMTAGQLAEMNALLFGDPFATDAVDKAVEARRLAEARELDARAAEAEAEARAESGWLF